MEGALFFTIISLVLSIIWALALFVIGQTKKRKDWLFYAVLYAPVIFGLIYYWSVFSALGALLLIIFAIERIAWGTTAREASGEDKLVWFLVILFIPLLGWLLYRATKLG